MSIVHRRRARRLRLRAAALPHRVTPARRSRELRNQAMRRAHRLGAPVAAIAEAARMSRMTVYRVLAASADPEELPDTSGDASG